MAHCTKLPLPIIDLPQPTQERKQTTEKFLLPDGLLTALAHYNKAEDREIHTNRQNAVKSKIWQRLTSDWQSEVDMFESYLKFHDQILQILTHLLSMGDGHLVLIRIAKHRTNFLPNSDHTRSALYQAGHNKRKFQLIEIEKIHFQKVVEPAETKWAALVVFAPKKDGSLRFCVDYRKLKSLPCRD